MNETTNSNKSHRSSQLLTSLGWVAALLVIFGLGLGTGYLVWGQENTAAANTSQAQAEQTQTEANDSASAQQVTRYGIPTEGEPSLGPDDAPITLVAFSDFECPYCSNWYLSTWPQIQAAYGDQVKLVFRDFPLPNHTNSQSAAEAANCAFEQGKYWEFQDLLFSSGAALGDETYLSFAQQLGLDEEAFQTCYESGRYTDEVTGDRDWAMELGVSSTPTFFINGIALVGGQSFETFQQVIEMELAGEFGY
jgi:protein-disulfide isomerase